jgi:hypothetical protein
LKGGVSLRLRMSMLHAVVTSGSLFTSVYVPITPGPLELEVPHMHTYVHRATHFTAHTLPLLLYYCKFPLLFKNIHSSLSPFIRSHQQRLRKYRDRDGQLHLYFKVYCRTDLLRHVSTWIKKAMIRRIKNHQRGFII